MSLQHKLKTNSLKVYTHLKQFATEGDKLIKNAPDVISFLEENGFIQYCRVRINSLSALLEGKSESHVVDHYTWTQLGDQVYAKLEKQYS